MADSLVIALPVVVLDDALGLQSCRSDRDERLPKFTQ